jgi:hypothetical protein
MLNAQALVWPVGCKSTRAQAFTASWPWSA